MGHVQLQTSWRFVSSSSLHILSLSWWFFIKLVFPGSVPSDQRLSLVPLLPHFPPQPSPHHSSSKCHKLSNQLSTYFSVAWSHYRSCSVILCVAVPVDVPKRQHLTQQGIPNIKAHLICISLKTPCYVWPARTAGTSGGGCGADQIGDCAGARLYKAGVCWLYLPPHIPGGHHPPCYRVQSVPYQHYTSTTLRPGPHSWWTCE